MDFRDEVLQSVQALIRDSKKITLATYNLWFRDLKIERLSKTDAVIIVGSAYKAEIITDRYIPLLEHSFEEVLGFHIDIIIDIDPDSDFSPEENEKVIKIIEAKPEDTSIQEKEKKPEQLTYLKYNPEYTFENFIVGSTNKLAQAACRAIAEIPDHDYNPLFIYSQSVLGKTHLLYAITNHILLNRPEAKIVYVHSESFTSELINALSKKTPLDYFRERYRTADVLLVDDIQFIAGKPSTQEEFFNIFNALYMEKKQIILTSDLPPKDIKNLEERLRTRFSWGLTVDIQPPDLELRIAILKSKAESMNLKVEDSVIAYIADNIKNNIRMLEGAVKKLKAITFLNNNVITMPVAREALKDLISENSRAGITVDQIIEKVALQYNVSVEDIKSKKRPKDISTARHTAIYILRTVTDLSLTDIAKHFDMHHTSVLSAINAVTENIKNDPNLDHEISVLVREIKNVN